MGAASIRHSPCPLFSEGISSSRTRTQNAPREGGIASSGAHLLGNILNEERKQIALELNAEPVRKEIVASHPAIFPAIVRLKSENYRRRFKSGTCKRVCYNFWPGRPPTASSEVENSHQLTA